MRVRRSITMRVFMGMIVVMRMTVIMLVVGGSRWSCGVSDLGKLSLKSQHVDLRCVDPAAIHPTEVQLCAQVERGDGILKNREGHARIYQGAEKHIAANSRKTVEVGDLHFVDSMTGRSCGLPIAISETGSKAFIEPERYPSRSSVTYL